MKQFFKILFASMLGSILGAILLFFIAIGVISGIAASVGNNPVSIDSNTILHIKLDRPIVDRINENPLDQLNWSTFKLQSSYGLNDLILNIKKASTDPNIAGIYLEIGLFEAGLTTIDELRNALETFKKSKKFIIAAGEVYSQKAYYLSSVANEEYLTPEGFLDFRGLSISSPFFKNAFAKLEVQPVIFKGKDNKYKSAVEPFTHSQYSAENREQLTALLGGMWTRMTTNISSSRKITIQELNLIADSLMLRTPESAVQYNLIDGLKYADEISELLRKKTKAKTIEDIKLISMNDYAHVADKTKKNVSRTKKIAVIFASGQIVSGKSEDNKMGSETIAEAIREARTDSSIKAIVLRVNSPGGSSLASEVIYREVVLARKAKPVVVSMGDLAASGGYWISSAATKIVANPTTITGSIGVYGMYFNAEQLFNNKLGITFDRVNTNKYSDLGSNMRNISAFEQAAIQDAINNVYSKFISHVATNRNLKPNYVDSIAKGRVWTGLTAKQLGLVDTIGGLETAIEIAAKLAKLKGYRLTQLPQQADPFTEFFDSFTQSKEEQLIQGKLGTIYTTYQQFIDLQNKTGIQALLPTSFVIE